MNHWSLLRCPKCRSELDCNSQRCLCTRCSGQWAVLEGEVPYFASDWLDSHAALSAEVEAQKHAAATYLDRRSFSFHWNEIRTREALAYLPSEPEVVLDLGCGPGLLAESYDANRVLGVDVSPELLQHARHRLPHLVGAVAEALPLADDSVDAIFARGVLHHVLEPRRAVEEMARVLRPGGVAILSDPRSFAPLEWIKRVLRRSDPTFAPTHRAFRRSEYRELVSVGSMNVVALQDIDKLALPWMVLADRFRIGHTLPVKRVTSWCLGVDQLVSRAVSRWPQLHEFGFIVQVVLEKTRERKKQ